MSNTKINSKKLCWTLGAVIGASLLVARCGVDPTASKVASAGSALTGANLSAIGQQSGPNVSTIANVNAATAQARNFISTQDMLTRMLNDLRQLSREQQAFARYFTLTNQWNAGAPDDAMAAYRNGVSKMLNSLSYQQAISVPVAIDKENGGGTILRVDIRAYGWDRNLWEEITRRNPYAFFTGSSLEQEINARTAVGRVAYVRADWCASICLQAPLYNMIMQIPKNLRELERDFGVDSEQDDQDGNVIRVGFSQSGVSSQYRMMEAHPTKFGTYWKSWDFNPEDGKVRRNLFEFALDPFVFGGDGFDFAAGEMIFQLPNGLSLYMLADNNGQRLEKAIQAVVQDPTREDAAVTNAVSCFRCHYEGMIPAKDEVRQHFAQNGFAFSRNEQAFVQALYPTQDKADAQYNAYKAKFSAAVRQLSVGFPYTFSSGSQEPVTQLARAFEAQLPLSSVAAELGLKPAAFQSLLQRTRLFSRRIGNVNTGTSTVKRNVFEDNFPFLIDGFGIGQPFNFTNLGD